MWKRCWPKPGNYSPTDTAPVGRIIVLCDPPSARSAYAGHEKRWPAPLKTFVIAPDTPIPYSPPLEEAFLPNVEKVLAKARELLAY